MKEYSDRLINNGSSSELTLNLEEKVYFHLAVDGATFAAIMEHHKELFRKVKSCDFLQFSSGMISLLATSQWDSICSNVSNSESTASDFLTGARVR